MEARKELKERRNLRNKDLENCKEEYENFKLGVDNRECLMCEIRSEIKDIEDKLKALPPEKWKPEIGEIYYFGDVSSEDYSFSQYWDNDSMDNIIYKLGLVRQTKEEGIEDGKRMYYSELYRSMSDVTDEMWEDRKIKKRIAYWDYTYNNICYDDMNGIKFQGSVYFTSIDKIDEAIEAIGHDNFVKYVLEIKQ